MRRPKNIILSVLLSFFGFSAQAYLTLGESAELVRKGELRVGALAQFNTGNGSGANVAATLDSAISDSSSTRFYMGLGDTDFFVGGAAKWIPIPDYEKQPAMGVRLGAIYGREGSENLITVRADPMLSKKWETERGLFIPYAAVPIMVTSYKSSSTTAMQFTVGTEYQTTDLPDYQFGGEFAMNAKDSFSYIAFYATMNMDSVKGLKRR